MSSKVQQVSPDVFMHQHGLRYDTFAGFGTTDAAVIVRALQTLNNTRALVDDDTLMNLTYSTPGFKSTPFIPMPSQEAVDRERIANQLYLNMLKTGDLKKVHRAVDEINAARMALGGQPEFIPFSEFTILSEGAGVVGDVARRIISLRQTEESELPTGSVIPWYDTIEAYQALKAYKFPVR